MILCNSAPALCARGFRSHQEPHSSHPRLQQLSKLPFRQPSILNYFLQQPPRQFTRMDGYNRCASGLWMAERYMGPALTLKFEAGLFEHID